MSDPYSFAQPFKGDPASPRAVGPTGGDAYSFAKPFELGKAAAPEVKPAESGAGSDYGAGTVLTDPLIGIPFAGAAEIPAEAKLKSWAHGTTYEEEKQKATERHAAYQREHPIASTIGQIGAGTAALAPLGATGLGARLLGVTRGGLIPAMAAGATSGAAIGSGDAALRAAVEGRSPGDAASAALGPSAAIGAIAPAAGRLVAGGVNAARSLVGTTPRAAGAGALDVAGVPVRTSTAQESTLVGAPSKEAWLTEQGARQGSAAGLHHAEAFDAGQRADMERAEAAISGRLNSTGAELGDATDAISRAHAADLAARAGQEAQVEVNHRGLMNSFGGPPVHSAQEAAEMIGGGIRTASDTAQAANSGMWERLRQIPGRLLSSVTANMGNGVRQEVTRATGLNIQQNMHPNASAAIDMLNRVTANPNSTRQGVIPSAMVSRALPNAASPEPLTFNSLVDVRKQLNGYLDNARQGARATGNLQDIDATAAVRDAYDAWMRNAVQHGFTGNGQQALAALDAANASHANYRATYTKQRGSDPTGAFIEGIRGRFGNESTPQEVAKGLFGSPNGTDAAQNYRNTVRLQQILSPDEMGIVKQGMFANLTRDGAGTALAPDKAAANLTNFLEGKGRIVSQALFNPRERAAIAGHRDNLRALAERPAPKAPHPDTANTIRDLETGRIMPGQLVEKLKGASGPRLATELKARLSREQFDAVKQALFADAMGPVEGRQGFGAQKIQGRLADLLNKRGGELARAVYEPDEIRDMEAFRRAHEMQVPPAEAANRSGTAAAIRRGGQHGGSVSSAMLGILGEHVLGHAGLGLMAARPIFNALRERAGANRAAQSFFGGARPQMDPATAQRVLSLVARGAMPGLGQ